MWTEFSYAAVLCHAVLVFTAARCRRHIAYKVLNKGLTHGQGVLLDAFCDLAVFAPMAWVGFSIGIQTSPECTPLVTLDNLKAWQVFPWQNARGCWEGWPAADVSEDQGGLRRKMFVLCSAATHVAHWLGLLPFTLMVAPTPTALALLVAYAAGVLRMAVAIQTLVFTFNALGAAGRILHPFAPRTYGPLCLAQTLMLRQAFWRTAFVVVSAWWHRGASWWAIWPPFGLVFTAMSACGENIVSSQDRAAYRTLPVFRTPTLYGGPLVHALEELQKQERETAAAV